MYKAIKDRIIIRLDESEERILSLPDLHKIRNIGQVVQVGTKVDSVKIGDKVVFHPYDEISLPEKNLVVVREKSLLATITD